MKVNYTHSSVSRMAIYAALRVDEVWRYDDGLMFLSLGNDGTYEPTNPSRQLPYLSIAEAMRQLDLYRSMGRMEWMRAFRRHVRETYFHINTLRRVGPPPPLMNRRPDSSSSWRSVRSRAECPMFFAHARA